MSAAAPPRAARLRRQVGDLAAHRHAGDGELRPPAEVGLHEHADGVAARVLADAPRRRADAALEAVADHAGAAADVALGDRAASGIVDRARRRGSS